MLAAIDLGSNSFHMVIALQDDDGRLQIIDRVKEMVRLNAGLDASGNLDSDSQQRALECLQRFSQRLRDLPSSQVRAVGTNTFRAAHNAAPFLERAEETLGHRISIIAGQEEARLVYLGAAFSLESSGRQRLVVDIGGGSTELIVGKGYRSIAMNSLYMGCVSFSRRFFKDGRITAKRLQSARAATQVELEPIVQLYRGIGWEEVVGTSGTIRAVDHVSRALGLDQDWLSAESFGFIDDWLLSCGHHDQLTHVTERRRPVFAGGYAIISAIFSTLDIQRLDCASGALREGVLYDLNGRLKNQDSRDLGVDALVSRFGLDRKQGHRIKQTALSLLGQVRDEWKLDQIIHEKLLSWSCDLHEIGTAIAFNQHHKHGSYIVENSDIDGFSRQQQRLLGILIRCHRQKVAVELFEMLPVKTRQRIFRLMVILRISVAMNRGRSDITQPTITTKTRKKTLVLHFDQQWLDTHPLTLMDLQAEQAFLRDAGFLLELNCQESRN
ncbi:MAG: Ppx/GppA family phosphatase [Acidiferrobacterales bacterium]|nr:Ppx/GppA family phosphatase [Acidiferrobacterales bacterium]